MRTDRQIVSKFKLVLAEAANRRTHSGNESGNVLVLAALCLGVLGGFVGLALDGGNVILQKRAAQTAADCAAIEAARELNWAANDGTTVTASAQSAAASNGFTDGSNGVTVTVNNGPSIGPHAGDSNYVEVIVKKNVSTIFMALVGQTSLMVQARAVAGPGPLAGCVYALGTTGTAITLSGTAHIDLNNCIIYDNSSDSKSLTASGGASIDATSIHLAGGYGSTGGSTFSPTPLTYGNPVADPLAFLSAPTVPVSCGAAQSFSGGNHSLTHGCYKGLSGSGGTRIALGPGIYIVEGNLTLSGGSSFNGSDITFYVTGTMNFSGASNMTLTAPTTGSYKGILYFQSRTDTNTATLSGGSGSTVTGIFYAPAAQITYSGSSGSTMNADFVAKTLSLSGSSGFRDYNTTNGESPLQNRSLVE